MDELRRLIVVGLPMAIPHIAQALPADTTKNADLTSSLSISGAVRNKATLSAESLRASPLTVEMEPVPLTVSGGEVRRTLTGYRGIKLTGLLDQAQFEPSDHNSLKRSYIVARARDDYTVVFSWSELYNTTVGSGVLVLVEKDGQAISTAEGPLALISRLDLRTGPRHVRWLTSIEIKRV